MTLKLAKKDTPKPLSPKQMRNTCNPKFLAFKTTKELEPFTHLLGQERAKNALQFGAAIAHNGYNLFVLGSPGTGRHSLVSSHLATKAAAEDAPGDWAYVFNFNSAHHPISLKLPPGQATAFRDAMEELIEDLRSAIPDVFNSDEYREKLRALNSEFEERQDNSFGELTSKAKKQDVAILRTPMGFALAPTSDGQVIKPEIYHNLPKEQLDAIEIKIAVLQTDLTSVLEHLPLLQKELREKIRELNADLTGSIVDASIKAISARFESIKAIQTRLADVREDLIAHTELFLADVTQQEEMPFPENPMARRGDPRFNRYRVNVMVSNDTDGDTKGAPIVAEDHPTLSKLVGRVEHLAQFGALITDFTMIRPGALHKANGGYLILDARKVLSEPFAWDALKRALRGSAIKIVSASDELGLSSTVSLEPEPIPLRAKVVLIGDRFLYYLLSTLDPEFADLFKVEVDFDDEFLRSDQNTHLYAQLIGGIIERQGLIPFSSAAVARVIDEASRLAEDAERLTLNVQSLADILCEASHWAQAAAKSVVTGTFVEKAISEQITRADRLRRKSQEAIDRGTLLIDVTGQAVGQINGLSVLSLGNFSFGRPTRITVRARSGAGEVVDIERETKLGGPLHSKGVMILSGYLAAHFVPDLPLSLWASIVFEQSYGGVDGDSASSAELYALLSALSGVPIKQSLAVTGSVNQLGEVQPIGGVNEKIEGFFDVCNRQGLTGKQGVLIPASNVKNLMLRTDVVKAAKAGRFKIYPIETVSQGIELLTGESAGKRNAKSGLFPKHSINGKVEETLNRFADVRRKLASKNLNPEVQV